MANKGVEGHVTVALELAMKMRNNYTNLTL